MRIALIGAVESTAVTLAALCEHGQPPVAVLSLAAEFKDRHSDFVDLESAAAAAGAPFYPIDNVNREPVLDLLRSLDLDWLIVVGWSQICSPELLAIPREGSLGYHPAALPRLRGRAVIAWTILLGLTETAGSIFMLEPTVDSGALLAQRTFLVDEAETVSALMAKHMEALGEMWAGLLPLRRAADYQPLVQDETQASYCAKRTADDGRVDWTQPAAAIERLVRAVSAPYPGAFTTYQGKRLVIDRAAVWTGPRHFGAPGQVLHRDNHALLVACGGYSALLVQAWRWIGEHQADRPPAVGRRFD